MNKAPRNDEINDNALQNTNLGTDATGTAFASPVWTQADPFGIPPPECIEADWSRDNHNGEWAINGKLSTLYPVRRFRHCT